MSRDNAAPTLDMIGTTFQRQVWQALRDIPVGCTVTYSQIAKRIGVPKAVRAVANACGANPIGVIVPCHRVIRTDGTLGGFRWGLERKKQLLEREKQLVGSAMSATSGNSASVHVSYPIAVAD